MKKTLFFLLIVSTITVAQEVSVFGAGDLNSSKPYGLTKTEKYILENRDELDTIDTKVKGVKDIVESINQRIDGLESIYESDSKRLNENILKLNNIIKQNEINVSEIEKLKNVTSQMLQIQEENTNNNNKNIEQLKMAISKLEKAINSINSSYISEKEFKSNMQQFVTKAEFEKLKKDLMNKEKQNSNKTTNSANLSKDGIALTNAELLAKAKELFKEDFFTKAIPIFEGLIEKNYKPAESNFYLGEIWYYRKDYNSAIRHFKESALLYDKADYMPKLLLHSAISFEKINDLDNASSFYSTLINVYPDSQEAKTANENLNSLK